MYAICFMEKRQNSLLEDVGAYCYTPLHRIGLSLYDLENLEMIILLLYLAWMMSEASAGNEHMVDIERPNADIVRQLNYVQRMSNNQSHNVLNHNPEGIEDDSGEKAKLVNISNDMSAERINTLRKYISGKTVGICDFTCHKCYRCSLVYGDLKSENKEGLFLDE